MSKAKQIIDKHNEMMRSQSDKQWLNRIKPHIQDAEFVRNSHYTIYFDDGSSFRADLRSQHVSTDDESKKDTVAYDLLRYFMNVSDSIMGVFKYFDIKHK